MGHIAIELHVQPRQPALGSGQLRSMLHEQVRNSMVNMRPVADRPIEGCLPFSPSVRLCLLTAAHIRNSAVSSNPQSHKL